MAESEVSASVAGLDILTLCTVRKTLGTVADCLACLEKEEAEKFFAALSDELARLKNGDSGSLFGNKLCRSRPVFKHTPWNVSVCGPHKETVNSVDFNTFITGVSMNCLIIEQTADGARCGRCYFHLPDGHTCPRHGNVRPEVDKYNAHSALTLENDMRKRKGLPLLPSSVSAAGTM